MALTTMVTGVEAGGAALSTGIIVGISVGVAGVLGLGAFFAWRHYNHRRVDLDVVTMRALKNMEVEDPDYQ